MVKCKQVGLTKEEVQILFDLVDKELDIISTSGDDIDNKGIPVVYYQNLQVIHDKLLDYVEE